MPHSRTSPAPPPRPDRVIVLGCETLLEELRPLLPPEVDVEVFDFALHMAPGGLREQLQAAIDEVGPRYDVVLLGYGLCSMAVVGLHATDCRLVIPRVDDCIACFLGSQKQVDEERAREPGTYFLSKGWIEGADTILDEHERARERYGDKIADRMVQLMLRHYRRLVYIDSGDEAEAERYRAYARDVAARYGLTYVQVPGDDGLLRRLAAGPWDGDDFVVVEPGGTVTFQDFKTDSTLAGNTFATPPLVP